MTAPVMSAQLLPPSLRDVSVVESTIANPPDDPAHRGVLWKADPGRLWLRVPKVARYLIESGDSITVESAAGADRAEVVKFLRGTPAVACWLERGVPVLHASVAARDGVATVIAGDSASGKSVLLAELLSRGWRLLSDDVAGLSVVDGEVAALPSYDEVRLWPDAEAKLSPPPAGIERFLDRPSRVGAVWLLGAHNSGVETQNVEGAQRFRALGQSSPNTRIDRALLDRSAMFGVAGLLAASDVPIKRLLRPRVEWTAPALAEIVSATAV